MAKIKGDEREDLKVLATGVTAALASRKVSSKNGFLLLGFGWAILNYVILENTLLLLRLTRKVKSRYFF